ncbi:MAG: FG-GAP repeat protein [Halobacteriales archaeon]|nr:FG-GAP repeat protein [Halobacteriales archaeon]
MFERRNGEWHPLGSPLQAPGCAQPDGFGYSIALSGDTLLVGAPADTRFGEKGSSYLFERNGDSWQMIHVLDAHGGHAGTSVALDDRCALVGAPWAKRGDGGQGLVYHFEW